MVSPSSRNAGVALAKRTYTSRGALRDGTPLASRKVTCNGTALCTIESGAERRRNSVSQRKPCDVGGTSIVICVARGSMSGCAAIASKLPPTAIAIMAITAASAG